MNEQHLFGLADYLLKKGAFNDDFELADFHPDYFEFYVNRVWENDQYTYGVEISTSHYSGIEHFHFRIPRFVFDVYVQMKESEEKLNRIIEEVYK